MRYLQREAEEILSAGKKMVFIAGPRQVGKTTFARSFLRGDVGYFNWDVDSHRLKLLRERDGFYRGLTRNHSDARIRVVLDEIHKYPRWKRFLKGVYDIGKEDLEILITGSGRLDIYQRGGDSLFGRYALFRLAPFTVGELLSAGTQTVEEPDVWIHSVLERRESRGREEALTHLEEWTGFPEPLFARSRRTLVRWRRARRELVFREDLRDLTRIRELGMVEQMTSLLPARVGSPLSVNSLREDVGAAYTTVQGWLQALERLYYHFEIRPYAARMARALRREGKIFLYDPTEILEPGPRFENVVALHLRKVVDAWTDSGYGDFSLHYVRDKEKRESDFLIVRDKRPWLLFECKLTGSTVDPSLRYFSERLRPQASIQIVRSLPGTRRERGNIWLVPAAQFLSNC